ncbi:hypothetical protein BDR04DRAFT_1123816, partial [Suillus decipiens]
MVQQDINFTKTYKMATGLGKSLSLILYPDMLTFDFNVGIPPKAMSMFDRFHNVRKTVDALAQHIPVNSDESLENKKVWMEEWAHAMVVVGATGQKAYARFTIQVQQAMLAKQSDTGSAVAVVGTVDGGKATAKDALMEGVEGGGCSVSVKGAVTLMPQPLDSLHVVKCTTCARKGLPCTGEPGK